MSETKLATSSPVSAAMVAVLSGNAIKLFAALYLHASNWASHQPVVECGYSLMKTWCGMSNDTIQRCITELEMAGYIKFSASNHNSRRTYTLLPDVKIDPGDQTDRVPENGTLHSENRNAVFQKSEHAHSRNQNTRIPENGTQTAFCVPNSGHVFKEQLSKNNTYYNKTAREGSVPENGTQRSRKQNAEQTEAFDTGQEISAKDAQLYKIGRERVDQIYKCLKAASPNSRIMTTPVLILDDLAYKVSIEQDWFTDAEIIKIAQWCLNEQEFDGWKSAALNVEQFVRNLRGIVSKYQAANPTRRRSPAEQRPRSPSPSELVLRWTRQISSGETTWPEIVELYGRDACDEICKRERFDPAAINVAAKRSNKERGIELLNEIGIRPPK